MSILKWGAAFLSGSSTNAWGSRPAFAIQPVIRHITLTIHKWAVSGVIHHWDWEDNFTDKQLTEQKLGDCCPHLCHTAWEKGVSGRSGDLKEESQKLVLDSVGQWGNCSLHGLWPPETIGVHWRHLNCKEGFVRWFRTFQDQCLPNRLQQAALQGIDLTVW